MQMQTEKEMELWSSSVYINNPLIPPDGWKNLENYEKAQKFCQKNRRYIYTSFSDYHLLLMKSHNLQTSFVDSS